MPLNLAAPFDKLGTTRKYAQQLADRKGLAVYIVKVHPESQAARLGMRYGTFDASEWTDQDPHVEKVQPK